VKHLWVRLTAAFIASRWRAWGPSPFWSTAAGAQFRRYLGDQQSQAESDLVDTLAEFYRDRGGWDGVGVISGCGSARGGGGPMAARAARAVAADAQGTLVYSARRALRPELSADELAQAQTVSGRRIVVIWYGDAGWGMGMAA